MKLSKDEANQILTEEELKRFVKPLTDELDRLKRAVDALLKVPEIRKAAANWAVDELLEVRNAMEGWPRL